ncbi:hypothetical protein B0J18DRAFT_240802 [Chaetomium sp. MPI-SDFR-AT-0129]|nr:hypothetical protein B0J18DRAFT_240802 [Chaetomium sp. MPI-SDFR-AT-0129]
MLNDLPAELLTEICSYLCCHCLVRQNTVDEAALDLCTWTWEAQQDLRNFSRACRTSHVAAEPFLYHHIIIFRERHLYLLIRTLLARPDLRLRVLELKISHSNDAQARAYPGPRPSSPLSVSLAQRTWVLRSHLSESEHEEPAALREAAEQRCLVSLSMGLVPNLKTFGFDLPGAGFPQTPDLSTHLNPWTLKSLEKLYFASFGADLLLDRLAPIIRLASNLQILHCNQCTYVADTFCVSLGRKTLADPPPLHNLSELILLDTVMTAGSLRNLLGAVGSGLAKVNIRRRPGTLPSPTEANDPVEFDEAVSLLRPWHRTLRELSFSIDGLVLPQPPSRLRDVGFLREFTVLEILRAQAAFLDFYGHEGPPEGALRSNLPPSMRELRLFGFSDLYPALRALWEAFEAGQFVCLSRIGIDDQGFEEYEPEGEAAQQLRAVATSFRSRGLDFVVHFPPGESVTEE